MDAEQATICEEYQLARRKVSVCDVRHERSVKRVTDNTEGVCNARQIWRQICGSDFVEKKAKRTCAIRCLRAETLDALLRGFPHPPIGPSLQLQQDPYTGR